MINVKYLILGGGPSGLTFAHMLKKRGETSFLIVEKENEVGGLCRSAIVDEAPLDIGGGHFLDVRRPAVDEFLFEFMPKDEWNLFIRDSRININGTMVSHPLEANIWQFEPKLQSEYLESVKAAGCNQNQPMPEKFVDWIRWKLGDKIAEDYMLPYNTKMFANELNDLGTYWLEKLPNVNFEDTLKSCREHHAYGSQPGHASFYYPKKYGYGEVWLRMGEALKDNLKTGLSLVSVNITEREATLSDSSVIKADRIVTTIPWNSFKITGAFPEDISDSISNLKSSSIEIRYRKDKSDTSAQWIYEPDMSKPYHRILVRSNFASPSRGFWLETRKERCDMYPKDDDSFRYMNEYAYPLNTVDKPLIMKHLLEAASSCNMFGLGRWGEHSHYNSDLVVAMAMDLATKI